ncbi:DUF4037 domain-containing protein [Allorhizocola rhizosphaerae]|uniref:DUF4037 domain-containing protein n=1 Tax=Allorhizocola rhizosphaerae TaxID=1872709 RepID=UPI000E3C5308|nr:DUF4037 domain-containing protein [Allorhizocola rhizosphaerae]
MSYATGAEVSRAFHREVVGPLLARHRPGLRYAAARLGSGSDVLGYDDETSRDHDWGCRLTVLVDEPDADAVPSLRELLDRELPETFLDLPVRFATSWDQSGSHQVHIETVMGFAAWRLGLDVRDGLSVVDWLSLPGQTILETAGGPVFHDETKQLPGLTALLARYPDEVERYVVSAGWRRLSQWFPMVGRTAERGQDVQSRLLTAKLADDLMHLAFVLCRRWPPYRKWRERAFSELPLPPMPLREALAADTWRDREQALAESAEILAAQQRALGLPTPERVIVPFWGRPYRTVDESLAGLLHDTITDPVLKQLPLGVGNIEQWVDNVDVLSHAPRRAALMSIYHAWLTTGDPAL